jgi:hypothetical protein
MTSPIEEPGFLFRMILDKLDGMDRKLDGQAEKLVSHEIRLSTVEKLLDDQRSSKSDSWKLWVGIATAILASLLGWLLPLITK